MKRYDCEVKINNDTILLIAYLIFFGSMFIFNEEVIPDKIFNYIVVPLALMPLNIYESKPYDTAHFLQIKYSLENPKKTFSGTKSFMFLFISFYVLFLAFSSFMTPEPSLSWFKIMFFYFSLPTLLFILITMRLSIAFKNCSSLFYTSTSSIVAMNAATNAYSYLSQNDFVTQLHTRAFLPKYGIATGFGTASCALTYTIALLCAVATIPNCYEKFHKIYLFLVATVLAFALLLTQSRAPLIGLIFALMPIVYWFYKSSTPLIKIWIGGCVAVFFSTPFILGSPFARKDSYRLEIWSRFISVIKDRPIFGYGERLNLVVIISDGENINHAHNLLYTSMLRGGIFSSLSLIVILTIALKDSLIVYKNYLYFVPISLFLLISTSSIIDYEIMLWSSGWHWASLWFCTSIWLGASIKAKIEN
jgi:hypothetical protein